MHGKLLELRRDATPGEKKLWAALRTNRKLLKLKFRRQHPIGPYIADFYCRSLNYVVEVDGLSHDGRQDYDQRRDEYMKQLGIKVLRFTESDVCMGVEAVIETIVSCNGVPPQPLPEGGA